MIRKKILFIINPISGVKNKSSIEDVILKKLNNRVQFDIVYTQKEGHGKLIAEESVGSYNYIIAVGGDGTVNEVSSALIGTDVVFGIVPKGSGNGLARHLTIPLDDKKALDLIFQDKQKTIDTCLINGKHFLNVAGIGFDAHVAHKFAEYGKRGKWSYIKLIFKEFFSYKVKEYYLEYNGERMQQPAFLISFANSTQFGNNGYIAPKALIDDGLIDVCIITKKPRLGVLKLAFQLVRGTIHKNKNYKTFKVKHIKVLSPGDNYIHFDGEPYQVKNELEIEVVPSSLNMLVG
jgi:YegS/Rv2252/BmrU family lipid kinase